MYQQLYEGLMRQRRPLEVASLEAQPAQDPELAAEGFNLFEEQSRDEANRLAKHEREAGQLAVQQARKVNLPWIQENQRREEAERAASAENCQDLNRIEWEPEARAQAIKDGRLQPQDEQQQAPSAE